MPMTWHVNMAYHPIHHTNAPNEIKVCIGFRSERKPPIIRLHFFLPSNSALQEKLPDLYTHNAQHKNPAMDGTFYTRFIYSLRYTFLYLHATQRTHQSRRLHYAVAIATRPKWMNTSGKLFLVRRARGLAMASILAASEKKGLFFIAGVDIWRKTDQRREKEQFRSFDIWRF